MKYFKKLIFCQLFFILIEVNLLYSADGSVGIVKRVICRTNDPYSRTEPVRRRIKNDLQAPEDTLKLVLPGSISTSFVTAPAMQVSDLKILLFDAISKGDLDSVKRLLAAGVDPLSRNRLGKTLVDTARLCLDESKSEEKRTVRLEIMKVLEDYLRFKSVALAAPVAAASSATTASAAAPTTAPTAASVAAISSATASAMQVPDLKILLLDAINRADIDSVERLLVAGVDPFRKDIMLGETLFDIALSCIDESKSEEERNVRLEIIKVLEGYSRCQIAAPAVAASAPTAVPAAAPAVATSSATIASALWPNLHALVLVNDERAFHLLLQNSRVQEVINFANDDGFTLIHSAAVHSSIGIFETLLGCGADPFILNRAGFSPLSSLVNELCIAKSERKRERYSRIMDRLFDYLQRVPDKSEVVRLLDHRTKFGFRALETALHNNNSIVAQKLLELGANPNEPDKHGNLPLFKAIQSNDLALVKAFIAAGVNVNNRKINNGITPLMEAVSHESLEIVKLLLDNRADSTLLDKGGRTALGIARFNRLNEIARILECHSK